MKTSLLVLAALSAMTAPALSQESRVDEILDRLRNANQHRDHVMVVAHRGSWWKDGEIVEAENSIASIERSVRLGVEMVELDVQKTSDGRFVILHDKTLERTTTCGGAVAEKTFDEVRECRLVVEGTGETTAETVPTLEEAYDAIRGRILMNVDIKLGVEELAEVIRVAHDMGVDRQIVTKARTGKPEEIEAARATLARIPSEAIFMPIIDDRDVKDVDGVRATYDAFRPEAVEVLNRWKAGTPLTADGGINFSLDAKGLAVANDTHIWINTLFQGADANLAGGRGDPLAVGPGATHEGWGFWVTAGATIVQTDEPEALVAYLQSIGARKPYETDDAQGDGKPAAAE
ncbi:glycerophosphodiester phosphodiesterase family protein [Antarcticirhabdus aurantiaca]|uniref:Glycerophosphodiester phosphodiesterase family protein n=1 Tax=Antarcticirhabdus aurantiaca TaxID=2606717 RepID=A0ACD4NW72_9HYPH|nr:glycerophosphodiester phosphodiesterase family protein [Antarcticirhabdus aurantiaca]WAJ31026.1 glycerophosphodiester phosphodiesterase family protein [Jeongeuplla avenae]